MEIIKHGTLREAARLLFFRCRKCGCIFKATEFEYKTKERPWAHYACKCPCCGYPDCWSITVDDLVDIIDNSYFENNCPPKHSQKNPLCAQAGGCRECWATWLKRETKEPKG